jgi:hypothetical protein
MAAGRGVGATLELPFQLRNLAAGSASTRFSLLLWPAVEVRRAAGGAAAPADLVVVGWLTLVLRRCGAPSLACVPATSLAGGQPLPPYWEISIVGSIAEHRRLADESLAGCQPLPPGCCLSSSGISSRHACR